MMIGIEATIQTMRWNPHVEDCEAKKQKELGLQYQSQIPSLELMCEKETNFHVFKLQHVILISDVII